MNAPLQGELVSRDIEVFRAGDYGDMGSYSEADLDQIAADYAPRTHEAPVVIGHPDTNQPAFGWTEKLWRNGKTLLAKVKLVPEMVDLIKNGHYKKVSVSLYRDFLGSGKKYLQHIGFLGAVPPAIKGLADIKLAQNPGEAVTIDFADEIAIDKAGAPAADISKIKKEANDMPEIMFSEAQHASILNAELHKKETELTAKFAEQVSTLTTKVKTLEAEIATEKAKAAQFAEAARKADVVSFADGLLREGKILPTMKDGMVEILLGASEAQLPKLKMHFSQTPPLIPLGQFAETEGPGVEKIPQKFSMVTGKAE